MNSDENKKKKTNTASDGESVAGAEGGDGVVFEEEEREDSFDEIEEAAKKTELRKNESSKSVSFDVENYGKTLLKPLRTFALDLKDAQRGGTTKTKEATEQKQKVPKKEKVPESAPSPKTVVAPRAEPIQVTPLVPETTSKTFEKKEKEISKAELRQELARSGILPVAKEPKKPESSPDVPTIHTYRNDAALFVKDKRISVANIATAAAQKRQREQIEIPKEGSSVFKNILLVALSVVLIIGGSFSGWFFYQKSKQAVTVPQKEVIPSLIFANTQLEVAFSIGESVIDVLEENSEVIEKRLEVKPGTILHIYPTLANRSLAKSREMRIDEFFAQLTPPPPLAFVRSLEDEYMVGFHRGDGVLPPAPFFILTTDSFENTFRGMLDWEKDMNESLSPLFGPIMERNVGAIGSLLGATSTIPTVLPYLFKDVVIKNINTRRLRNKNGNVVLLYAFPNAKTVIITTNEDTLLAVFKLLSAS